MLVKVLNFGSNWWVRFGRDPEDAYRFTRRAAYYNSTGVRCASKVRRHWIISGLLRVNGTTDFNPNLPNRAIGHTFVCSEIAYAFGGNRLLFKSKAAKSAIPDSYLVVVSSAVYGWIDFTSNVWKSVLAQVIAASQLRDMQEAMLLMKPGDWIQTSSGFWQLNAQTAPHERTELARIGDPISV